MTDTANISLNNSYVSNKSPEMQKRLAQQENFTAIDREQVKKDAVEISKKAGEQVKENFVCRTLRNVFGVKDPKKFLKSFALMVSTVVGIAVLGNKMSNKTADWGIKVDEMLQGNSVFAKGYNAIANTFKKAGKGIKNFFFKSETIKDVANVVKKENRMKPKADLTRGYGRGFVSIFSLTPTDILGKVLDKSDDKIGLLKKLVGDEKTAQDLLNMFRSPNKDNREFCELLSKRMRKYLGNGKEVGNKEFLAALKDLQKGKFNGKDVSEFTNVAMKEKGLGGIVGSWWPVNIINKIGEATGIKKLANFSKGNLGDSLVKFNAVNGTLADTKLGQLMQKSITVPTESYSNFVNDKSGLGVFLCFTTIMSLWNNVQDAPKDKKLATAADDVVGTIGSIALATPAAFAATYGLASLSKLPGKGISEKALKQVGKFFALGLNTKNVKWAEGTKLKYLGNKAVGFAGGFMRFALVMMVFNSMFQKPIKKVINNIFGKPYDPNEAERQKQIEAQKNTIIPELGITQGQLLEKIQNNPQAAQRLQTDAELVKKISQNPKLLVDYLDGKDINNIQNTPSRVSQPNTARKPVIMSEANRALLNRYKTNQQAAATANPAASNTANKTNSPTALNNNMAANAANAANALQKTPNALNAQANKEVPRNEAGLVKDTATYIPSSAFIAKRSNISPEVQNEFNAAMQRADKALANAEKYI